MSVHSEGDNDSTRSFTQDSTSTYAFSGMDPPHEAFETFQHKVLALTHSIYDVAEVALQRVRGGSYNPVVVAHLTLIDQGELSVIFRMPRDRILPEGIERNSSEDIETDILNQVAVLQLLQSRSIPAPKILAYDASGQNAIGLPYVLQQFSHGKMLEDFYEDMTFQEKMQVAETLADFLVRMETVTFEESGTVVAAQTDSAEPATKASALDAPLDNLTAGVRGFSDPYEHVLTPYTATFPRELIGGLLKARLDGEAAQSGPENGMRVILSKIYAMFEDMCSIGLFEDDILTRGNILHHWDLQPRNILVKTTTSLERGEQNLEERLETCLDIARSSEKWIIDVPPIWLCDFPVEKYDLSRPPGYDFDEDLQPAERYDSSKGMLSPESVQIQARFEERFVSNMQRVYPMYTAEIYQDEAYGRGRWIRRMARYALFGLHTSEAFKRFRSLEQEWSTARSNFASASSDNVS
ncbi:hypothetical protein CKM354_000638600 [Cercospora kikuchii]|uniref:Aminoglycoside phosphotransferase domain-containing protein n=1 Tax=Cercospora kikuchii TaxID=84275 RepID=A0A9P3CKN8_9PEZI|nr:uncharacterized protein CKM354_000638600 [Cercospora kikuchii]GIZ43147.1 hypothetical protein CKM354_000638600 [Cercospora kikuchii]